MNGEPSKSKTHSCSIQPERDHHGSSSGSAHLASRSHLPKEGIDGIIVISDDDDDVNANFGSEIENPQSSTDGPQVGRHCCDVSSLLEKPFRSCMWREEERVGFLKRGRPIPTIPGMGVNRSLYLKYPWLTACKHRRLLHCWPCVLVSKGRSAWIHGFQRIALLEYSAKQHGSHAEHIRAEKELEEWTSDLLQEEAASDSDDVEMIDTGVICLPKPPLSASLALPVDTVPPEDNIEWQIVIPTVEESGCQSEPMPENLTTNSSLIQKLQENSFLNGTWTDKQRYDIIAQGKPPCENLSFGQSHIEHNWWLTGSSDLAKLFCWPCLLFNSERGMWTCEGVGNVDDIQATVEQHGSTATHMKACVSLIKRERAIIEKTVEYSEVHKMEVMRKRELVTCMTDVVCFYKKYNLNHTATDFAKLLTVIGQYDVRLMQSNELNASVEAAKEAVSTYGNHIFSAVDALLLFKVIEEVQNSKYISLILQSTSTNLYAAVIRHANKNGVVHETFYKFVTNDGLASSLFASVRSLLVEINCESKLVGYAYDGVVLRQSQISEFNCLMTRTYPMSRFYYHDRFDVLSTSLQVIKQMPQCSSFFAMLQDLSDFIRETPRAFSTLSSAQTVKDSSSKVTLDLASPFLLVTVRSRYSVVLNMLERIFQKSVPIWKKDTKHERARKLMVSLQKIETVFSLVLISNILSLLKILSATLDTANAIEWKIRVASMFQLFKTMKKKKFGETFSAALDEFTKSCVLDSGQLVEARDRCLRIFSSVVNCVMKLIKNWAMKIAKVDSVHTKLGCKPPIDFKTYAECFPSMNVSKLPPQLEFLLADDHFKNQSTSELIKTITDLNLTLVLPELFEFLLLISVVPATPLPSGSSVFERIATYANESSNPSSSSALAYIENDKLTTLQRECDFHAQVIDFICKEYGLQELKI